MSYFDVVNEVVQITYLISFEFWVTGFELLYGNAPKDNFSLWAINPTQ